MKFSSSADGTAPAHPDDVSTPSSARIKVIEPKQETPNRTLSLVRTETAFLSKDVSLFPKCARTMLSEVVEETTT